MERYRVFLSSPADVLIERDHAEKIVKRLNAERVDHPPLELVRWEFEYYGAQADFQAQIPSPSDCELVVCIFWKRLGSDLSPKYARDDGTLPTGTEYEFEEALKAAATHPDKLPDVLVYRKTAEVMFSASTVEFERAQYNRFLAFWQRWFHSEQGHFLAGFQSFATSEEFDVVFERNLLAWLRHRETEVIWTQGSPYRGLEPFEFVHAPIFFGRWREVERTRARLLTSASGGKPFLLIVGASGAGKSSLSRAGLIPRLCQPGGLSTLAASMRWTILTPGDMADDWPSALATRLLDSAVLGDELMAGDFNNDRALACQLARADASAGAPIVGALRRAREQASSVDSSEPVELLLLIDQLEELFAWPHDRATHFLRLLDVLCRLPGSPILIVATMRSDFQHRLSEFPALAALAGRSDVKGPYEGEQILELALPSGGDLREMILNPTRAAGLTFEISGERDLQQLIEAEARPEAMPSVQFLLAELYAARVGKTLTLSAFDALKGVEGVMAKRGEDIYWFLDEQARNALPRVVRALVTQIRSDVPASRRRAPASAFNGDASAARLVAALSQARLIISDHGELRFTHDSLLVGWTRLKDQIAEEQRLFAARERLEDDCSRWKQESADGERNRFLLKGFALAEGQELLAKWGADALRDTHFELPEYITASDSHEKLTRRITQAIGWGLAAVFALFSVLLFDQWQRTVRAQKETQASLWIAQSQANLREQNITGALENADRAFRSLPTEQSRSTLFSALMEISPHLVTVTELGSETTSALAWTNATTVGLALGSGKFRTLSPLIERPEQNVENRWNLPLLSRKHNEPTVVAFGVVAQDQLLAVFSDTSIGLLSQGGNDIRIHPATATALPVDPAANAVAIDSRGTMVAMASIDKKITLYRCDWTRTNDVCNTVPLKSVRGLAVAISPDGASIAVGGDDGKITIFDSSGEYVRDWEPVAPIASLGWAHKHNWIAAGTSQGDVVVFDVGSSRHTPLPGERFGGAPISALAWGPDDLNVAFVCNAMSICLSRTDSDGASPLLTPALRLEGHQNGITRLAWAQSGRYIASSAIDGTIRAWDLLPDTKVTYAIYSKKPAEFLTVAAARDGKSVAAGAKDGSIHLWRSQSTSVEDVLLPSPSEAEVYALAWSRDGTLAVLDANSKVRLISSAKQRRTIPVEQIRPSSRLSWVGTNILAIPLRSGGIALLDTNQSAENVKILDRGRTIYAATGIAAEPTERVLFASYTDGAVVAWDLLTEKSEAMRDARADRVRNVGALSLSVSRDGRFLASSSGDSFVPIYTINRRTSWLSLKTESSETITVAFSPNGKRLAALGADNRIYVWDFVNGKASRFLSVVPSRAAISNATQANEHGGWLAWISDESIAVVTSRATINVLQLDTNKWLSRIDNLVRRGVNE
jgi:WD40 repeat protein